MSEAPTIRVATVDDTDAIAEFQTVTWNEVYRGIVNDDYNESTSIETRALRWRERLAGSRSVLVAEQEERVVAVSSCGPRRDDLGGPELELMSFYLAPELRGTGLADQLIERALGDRAAVLWVFDGNERAVGFYRRHGFEPDSAPVFDLPTGVYEIRMSRSSAGR